MDRRRVNEAVILKQRIIIPGMFRWVRWSPLSLSKSCVTTYPESLENSWKGLGAPARAFQTHIQSAVQFVPKISVCTDSNLTAGSRVWCGVCFGFWCFRVPVVSMAQQQNQKPKKSHHKKLGRSQRARHWGFLPILPIKCLKHKR